MGDTAENEAGLRWYQGVPRYAWMVLLLAGLGWLFDAMDQNLFAYFDKPFNNDLMIATIESGLRAWETCGEAGGIKPRTLFPGRAHTRA